MSTHLVVGLGNPGRRYEETRHNAGFLVVDRLGRRHGEAVEKKQLGALVATLRIADHTVVVAKPQGFMNLSGHPTVSLKGFYKVDEGELVVIHDDVDLPFGDVRIKRGGGHGGHNGLRDISEKLGSGGYIRVRFGVGRPPPGHDTAAFVLSSFSAEEQPLLDDCVDTASDAVAAVVMEGVTAAMNRFNTRRRAGSPEEPAP